VEKSLTEILSWKAETENQLKALSSSLPEIKWRAGLVDNSFVSYKIEKIKLIIVIILSRKLKRF